MIPVLRPTGGKEEIDALAEVIKSGWWGKGKKVEEFEKKFAEMVGSRFAVAMTSCTHALDLALKVYGARYKTVISPTMSFASTAAVGLWNDCKSILADVNEDDLCINPTDVEQLLQKFTDTEAIIVVDTYGVLANIPAIRNFYKGVIIEDCAHACYTPGAGRMGDIACWSFQAVKSLPAGDGGMITTDDEEIYELLKPMTWLGIKETTYERAKKGYLGPDGKMRPGYTWDYEIDSLGWKCYMIDLTAAICLEQLKKLEAKNARRRAIAARYTEELGNYGYIEPPVSSYTAQYYCARVPANCRNELISFLADKGIHTSVHFKPLHLHPLFKQDRSLPVAERIWPKLITLPVHGALADDHVTYIIECIKEFFDNKTHKRVS